MLSIQKFLFKASFFVFLKLSKLARSHDFGKSYTQTANLMLIKAESKAVIAGHTGRVHLEKPGGRTKVLLVIPTVCNKQRMKNKDVNICY